MSIPHMRKNRLKRSGSVLSTCALTTALSMLDIISNRLKPDYDYYYFKHSLRSSLYSSLYGFNFKE